jgi:NitT/TauT family transport system ATP-binding protein
MPAELTAHNLAVVFDVPGEAALPALGPISFDIAPGEFTCLLGPSGCGKTTLIRVFAGLQAPTQGEACLSGETITGPSPRVGLMFQSANLLPWRTVIDNVALPLELAGVPKSNRYQTAADLIPVLGLEGFETTYPGELSGGMAQRVALGRILVQNPDVLLLDEPLGALDAMTREKVGLDLLRMWSQNRQTVIMVTHDINEAVLLSDRVLVMSQRPGRIVADIPVYLPRPRNLEQIYDAGFVEIARLVRAAIDRA